MNPPFQHRHAAHCESGTVANLLSHHGLPLSEPMAFGLAAGLSFAYLPVIKIQEMPLIAYRLPPRAIIRGVCKPLGVNFRIERFRTEAAGEARLDALLARGLVVGVQASVYWLPYFPEDMRFHFNAHNLVVYGREGDEYLVSDPVGEHPVRCHRDDLRRARFAKGMLAPKGTLYYPEGIPQRTLQAQSLHAAIRRVAWTMQAPLPIFGVGGIRGLARKIARLDPAAPQSSRFVGHIVRMQEEIGTGGAGFRFLYAAFLQEAAEPGELPQLAEFSARLMEIGDEWRAFALAAARMVKGRDAFEPPAIAALLHALGGREAAFFRDLKAVLP
jgi:hypothetical protein